MYDQALPQHPAARSNLRHFLPLAMVIFVFSLHGTALFNPFFGSDLDRIVDNPAVTQADGWQQVLGLAERDGSGDPIFRPATELTYWLNAQLTGLQPLGFRVVNLLLLAVMGWMLAAWLQGYAHTAPAWFAAAFVVAHPLIAEPVNVIVGRADFLALIGVFGFAALQQRAITRGWNAARIIGCLLMAALAITAKETGLLVAPIALIQPLVRQPELDPHFAGTPRLKHWLPPVAVVALTVLLYGLARVDQIGAALSPRPERFLLTDNPLLGVAFAERWPASLSLTWHYVAQLFWTDTSATQTPWPLPAAGDASVWLGGITLAVLLGVSARLIWRRSWLCSAALLAIGQLLLVGHWLVPIGPYASNRLALPLLAAAAAVLAAAIDRVASASRRKRAALLIPGGVVLVLMVISVANTHRAWTSPLTRATADATADPDNPVARYHYGMALLASGLDREGQALEHLAYAAQREPVPGQAHVGYGHALASVGQLDNARAQYKAVLQHHPDHTPTIVRLTELCLFTGELDHAATHLKRVPNARQHHPDILHLRARLHEARGDAPLALETYRELLTKRPHHPAREDYQALQAKLNKDLENLINPDNGE